MNTLLNPYLELGVSPDVTLKELKQAYRQAVLRYHPDSAMGQGNPRKFHAVTEAYKQLRDVVEHKRPPLQTVSRTHSPSARGASGYTTQRPSNRNHDFWGQQSFRATQVAVDLQTSRLSVEELLKCLRYSNNHYVQQIAAEALLLKRNPRATDAVLDIFKQAQEPEQIAALLRAFRQAPHNQVEDHLFAALHHDSIEIVAAAVASLEKLDSSNRERILRKLHKRYSSVWSRFANPMRALYANGDSLSHIGGVLLRHHKLSEEQLAIALLLQKRFPLLLGQILRHLEYVDVEDLRHAISLQKSRYRY
jgi:hypothetical protein